MNGMFTGTVKEKVPNGQGTFVYSDDSVAITYTGNWENGTPVGNGHLEYDGFNVEYGGAVYQGKYVGEALAGIPNGTGRFTYSGAWKGGTISGTGELEFDQLNVNFQDSVLTGYFLGEVVNGLPYGTGEFSAEMEESYFTYKGSWQEGYFFGNGMLDTNIYTVTFTDGRTRIGEYRGETLDGIASGNGIFRTQNDNGQAYTYDGAFTNGLFHGYGCLKWDDPDYRVQKGNFSEGEFSPTPLEYFIAEGSAEDDNYTIDEKAVEFIINNPDLFLTTDLTLYEGKVDNNFEYKAYAKNQSLYGDKLIVVTGEILQIREKNEWGADHTFCIITDNDYNFYYVHMYGFADNVYEDDYVTMIALPLDYFTYESVAGFEVWAIACAAISLEK